MPNALDNLRDIHLPDAISVWPLAYGYWILLALMLVAAGLWYLRRQRFTVHRDAERHLDALAAEYASTGNGHALAKGVNVLLRRTALSLKPRHEAASLTGSAWIDFLHACSGSSATFSDDLQQVLVQGVYQSATEVNAQKLLDESRTWIRSLPPGESVLSLSKVTS